jgi:hypothetical protein
MLVAQRLAIQPETSVSAALVRQRELRERQEGRTYQ